MLRCLQLAAKGRGYVAPNPMVGAVVVHKDLIIGEGYHRACGQAHAEVNAIASVRDQRLLEDSTLYVNLEPCSHHGKTPPCADLIIGKKIPRVVIGTRDPFPKVSGGGIRRLEQAGVELITGVLEAECNELNKRFFTFHSKKRPYIILKWAQSADGYMDRHRQVGDGQLPVVFSDDYTRLLVHKMRAEESGIIVGKNTALLDSPQLTTRYWCGESPRRLIADSGESLSQLMERLYGDQVQSLIVEGGAKLLAGFIEAGLWDEARVEHSEVLLGAGVKAPQVDGVLAGVQKCKKTNLLHYRNEIKPKNA